jgi:nitrite reductase/ring-hydroxylating ferredoxin subunit
LPDFVRALPLVTLREGEITPLVLDDLPLAFYLVGGRPYCTTDVCTHEYNLLSEGGYVENGEVECPYHGARYDVRTGSVTAMPAVAPLRSFPVEVRDGYLFVALG